MIHQSELIRSVVFRPYRKGMGPIFSLCLFDLNERDHYGRNLLGYRLRIKQPGKFPVVLFEGEDFACSPLHGVDSDATVESLMGFLTLRPGDTDPEYFENYTAEQREFCEQWAEALSCEVQDRFDKQRN